MTHRYWIFFAWSLAACTNSAAELAPQAPPGQAWLSPKQLQDSQIVVAPVGKHDVGGSIVASGKVTFDDLRVSHVFSPVSGRVTQILAQPGQRVKKDQPLAIIQSPDVGQVFSDLARAQADVEAAEKDYRRQKELFENKAVSQKEFEASQANLAKSRAELERAQRKANFLARGDADGVTQEFRLRAPIDGEIIVRSVNPGVEVQGTFGGAQAVELFTVGELDRVWVMADVFEIDLGQIKKNAAVSVSVVAYPLRAFEGRVEWISGSLDAGTRTAKVRVSIDNHERLLKPEMYATVSIAVDEQKAMAIPRSALLRLGDQTVVFVQIGVTRDGKLQFERRPVAVDEEQGGDFLPVTHGLSEGDRVVMAGGVLLLGMI